MSTAAQSFDDIGTTLTVQTRKLWDEPRKQRGEPGLTISNLSLTNNAPSHPESNYSEVPPRVVLTRPVSSQNSFRLLQRWDGTVVSLDDDTFTAVIRDKTNPLNYDEEVTISFEEVPPEDHGLIMRGAIFYWSVGYSEGPGRPRERASRIRFRRLPAWSEREISDAANRAAALIDALNET